MTKRWALGCMLTVASAVTPLQVQASDLPADDQALTPYGEAVLAYKNGKYDEAYAAITTAEKSQAGDPATEILKAKIQTEQRDFAGAKATLENLNGNAALTPQLEDLRTLAFGDMCLKKRSFDESAKFYESLLSHKPGDPDLILKLVYTRIGAGDFVAAGKYASSLKPLDPKNPYDDHASYYFAKAAIAQASGRSAEADENIQAARTDYGISVTNRYLKTYLELFAAPAKGTETGIAPAPLKKDQQSK